MAVLIDVIGRLGNKPEIRTSAAGNEFMTFNLAVEDFNKGEKETVWFTVADFSNNIKKKIEFLNKGSMVHVIGEEKVRIYHDRDNNPRIARDIRVSFLSFVSTGGTNTKQEQEVSCGTLEQTVNTEQRAPKPTVAPAPAQPQAPVTQTVTTSTTVDIEDDLPF